MQNKKISAGMKAAQRRGVHIGRPADEENEARVASLLVANKKNPISPAEISRLLGLPQSTVYSIVNRLKLAASK